MEENKKQEILEKSRQENKGKDIVYEPILIKGFYFGSLLALACLIVVEIVESIFFNGPRMEHLMIFSALLGPTYIYIGKKTNKSIEFTCGIIISVCFVLFIPLYVFQCLGMLG